MFKDTRTHEDREAWNAMTREERHAVVAQKEVERKAKIAAQRERFAAWLKGQEPEHETMSQAFRAELMALMEKYGASFSFTCDEGSDTCGLTGERMVVHIRGNYYQAEKRHAEIVAAAVFGWGIAPDDLKG